MDVPERRHLARMSPERPVYIDLRPDNGGIVLNVSDEGLCFQAVSPVKEHQSVNFSFSDNSVQTDAVGEVVWTDEARKYAGLRFTQVSNEARSEIKSLLRFVPPATDTADEPRTMLVPVTDENEGAMMALVPAEIAHGAAQKVSLSREPTTLPSRGFAKFSRVNSHDLAAEVLDLKKWLKLPAAPSRIWLSRILVAALFIYAVGASLMLYRYRKAQPQTNSSAQTSLASPQAKASLRASDEPSALSQPKRSAATAVARNNAVPGRGKPSVTQKVEPARPLIKDGPVRFEYPVVASGAPSGAVDLRILVTATGSVEDVRVLSGKRALADASVRAVRRWRYHPIEVDGHPAPAEAHVRMRFTGDEAISISFRE
jgi:TonB family protein